MPHRPIGRGTILDFTEDGMNGSALALALSVFVGGACWAQTSTRPSMATDISELNIAGMTAGAGVPRIRQAGFDAALAGRAAGAGQACAQARV